MSAHWLIPPRPAPMGSRPAPGVPAVGHTLDPQRCPACLGGVLPALPTPAPKPPRTLPPRPAKLAPTVAITAPKPPTEPDSVHFAFAPSAAREALSSLIDRVGWHRTARAVNVTIDTLRAYVDGRRMRATTVDKVADAVHALGGNVPDAVESLSELEVAALRERVRSLGHAQVLHGAGVSAVTLHRALAHRRTGEETITKLRKYVRSATTFAAGTLRDRVLVAAYDLATSRGDASLPFDSSDLIVRAWTMFPESFSLRGYPTHPDANRVLSKLSGEDGPIAAGHLRRVSTSTYAVTMQGVARAMMLTGQAVAA